MNFTEILHTRYGLSHDAIQLLMACAEQLDYNRKTVITAAGQRDEYVYFIERGATRTYVMRGDRCVIISFAFEGDEATLTPASSPRSSVNYQIETLEATTMLRFRRSELEQLFALHAELANWGRCVAEDRLRLYEEYFAEYAWREKSKQYKYLLHEYPQLLQRVPLKDLASYLYVTPQTLSRIRAEIVKS